MSKRVLGNDPFQRGAAARAEAPLPRRKPKAAPPKIPEPEPTLPPVQVPPPTTALTVIRRPAQPFLGSAALQKIAHAAEGALRVFRSGMGWGGTEHLDAYGKDAQVADSMAPVLDFLYRHYWRVRVEGADTLPKGPAILVANHSGALPIDGPILNHALHEKRPDLPEPRWLLEDAIFRAPFLGTLLNRLGAIRATPENAERLLAERRPILVFPEGLSGLQKPFQERYQLKRFGRGGFVKIALRTQVPIIPVAVVGAEEALPLLAKLPVRVMGMPYLPLTPLGPVPLPSKWLIRFGTPIPLSEGAKETDAEEIQRATEKTREAIRSMLGELLRERSQARS